MKDIKILDGGFSTQLSLYVGDRIDGDPLWSARFNQTNSDAVIQTHLDFLNSGADIILTNTYQASVDGFMKYLNLTNESSIQLIKDAVQYAHIAIQKFLLDNPDVKKDRPWVVGSIGPYGAHLHDGSEYTGNYADRIDKETIQAWHRPRINAIIEAGVDALAFETIPCLKEAEALVELLLLEHPNMKFWVSFQCRNDGKSLAHGEPFVESAIKIWNQVNTKSEHQNNLIAVGVNCISPQYITELIDGINNTGVFLKSNHLQIPLIVYPNSGEIYDTTAGGWKTATDLDSTTTSLHEKIPTLIKMGTKIIGGCCRTYAKDIKIIRECVEKYCASADDNDIIIKIL